MTRDHVLDEILLVLADHFEAARPNRVCYFSCKSAEEFEPLRECFAWMVAEGFAGSTYTGQSWLVRLTPEGYRHLKPRIDAIRAMPIAQ